MITEAVTVRRDRIRPVLELLFQRSAAKFFDTKILPASDCAPWIKSRFSSKSMIAIYRRGEGVPGEGAAVPFREIAALKSSQKSCRGRREQKGGPKAAFPHSTKPVAKTTPLVKDRAGSGTAEFLRRVPDSAFRLCARRCGRLPHGRRLRSPRVRRSRPGARG